MVSAERLRLDGADTGREDCGRRDNTMLYKYPQAEFPYADLIAVDAVRGKSDPEYELLDTGIFDGNRYFDVVIESPGLFVDLGPWQSHLLALK